MSQVMAYILREIEAVERSLEVNRQLYGEITACLNILQGIQRAIERIETEDMVK